MDNSKKFSFVKDFNIVKDTPIVGNNFFNSNSHYMSNAFNNNVKSFKVDDDKNNYDTNNYTVYSYIYNQFNNAIGSIISSFSSLVNYLIDINSDIIGTEFFSSGYSILEIFSSHSSDLDNESNDDSKFKNDDDSKELIVEDSYDDLVSALDSILKENNNEIFFENDIEKLLSRDNVDNSDYYDYVDSLKNYSSLYEMYLDECVNYLNKYNISVNKDQIEYFETNGSTTTVYLKNGIIIKIDGNNYTVQDYESGVLYNYKLSDDNKYILDSVVLGDNSNQYLKFEYTEDGIIVRDLTKENEQEQIIGIIDDIEAISSMKYIDENTIIFSDGYGLNKKTNEDGSVEFEVANYNKSESNVETVSDKVDKINELAESYIDHNGNEFRNWYFGHSAYGVDWCAIFVSYLLLNSGDSEKDLMNTGNGHGYDGAGDIPRYSVPEYGSWIESDSDSMPQAGDVILFNPKASGQYYSYDGKSPYTIAFDDNNYFGWDKYTSSHVGYIYKVEGNIVYTIEGNTNSDDADLSNVAYHEYDLTNDLDLMKINGYYRPNYDK